MWGSDANNEAERVQRNEQGQNGAPVGVIGRPAVLRADAQPFNSGSLSMVDFSSFTQEQPMYFAPQPPPPPPYSQSITSMQRMPIPAPLNMQNLQHQQNLQQQQMSYGTSPRYGDSRTPPPQMYASYSPTSSFRAPMASSPMSSMTQWDPSSRYQNDGGNYQSNYMPRQQRQQQAPPLVSADGHIYQVHFKRAHRNFLLSPMVQPLLIPIVQKTKKLTTSPPFFCSSCRHRGTSCPGTSSRWRPTVGKTWVWWSPRLLWKSSSSSFLQQGIADVDTALARGRRSTFSVSPLQTSGSSCGPRWRTRSELSR